MCLIHIEFILIFNGLGRGVRTRFYAMLRGFSLRFDRWAHTTMATYTKLKSGSWRARVRRKGQHAGNVLQRDDARRWTTDT
jgi:hypothetical protein